MQNYLATMLSAQSFNDSPQKPQHAAKSQHVERAGCCMNSSTRSKRSTSSSR
jgi:hypothetical protein